VDVDDDARTVGRRVRQIRNSRRKSLEVISGLSGISRSSLSRIERGERALDSRSETVALANALQISPAELTRLPVPAPADGDKDAVVKAIRRALIAVSRDDPGGQVVPLNALRTRVEAVAAAQRQCDYAQVGRALPALIRDVHTSMAAGRDLGELLALAVLLHVHDTQAFLHRAGASPDLCWQAAMLARQAAREHGAPEMLGLAAFGAANGLLAAGEFDMAQAELDAVVVPRTTEAAEQLDGMLALSRSLVAAADNRPGDVTAPLEHASELAQRTGQGNAYGLNFGPTNVGRWRMAVALEARDYPLAASIAEGLRPELLPSAGLQAGYWADYGRALARLRGRQDDAVWALRRAERISPARVQRHPFVRGVPAELLSKPHRGTVGRELRGMAYRAGLPG
jgi:transcriptional regulator with XRE-family HTH domain